MITARHVAWAYFSVLTSALGGADTAYAQECADTVSDQAVKVEYETDGAAVGIPSALLFRGSHDGTVRAEDIATGGELWRFRAPEAEAATSAGERLTHLAVLRFDANGDGVIDPRDGDRVWIYFGLQACRRCVLRARCHRQNTARTVASGWQHDARAGRRVVYADDNARTCWRRSAERRAFRS